ncbi:hypothetical protein OSB04_009625 [Centaurea solstitialis]|uniref:Uncharacterized protein n=1 Tax=Centaurea solstitialis TaxID=347529 RepID=A0AA38TGU9_9ASTR|nr:hypothetical protein OSB04_009625 [Centaurea solstitialis]
MANIQRAMKSFKCIKNSRARELTCIQTIGAIDQGRPYGCAAGAVARGLRFRGPPWLFSVESILLLMQLKGR